jgi:ankyrin repeat protein
LKQGCSLDFSKDNSTPMHCAAYYGHYQIIILLLSHGIPVKIKNCHKNLPIEEACTK